MQATRYYKENIKSCPYIENPFLEPKPILQIKFTQNEPNSHKQMANFRGVQPIIGTVQTDCPLDILARQQCYGSIFKLQSLHTKHTLINKSEATKGRRPKMIERRTYKCHERRSLCRPVTFFFQCRLPNAGNHIRKITK